MKIEHKEQKHHHNTHVEDKLLNHLKIMTHDENLQPHCRLFYIKKHMMDMKHWNLILILIYKLMMRTKIRLTVLN